MPHGTVISVIEGAANRASANHASYAAAFRYTHEVVSYVGGARGGRLCALHKYECLLDQMQRGGEGDVVLLLTDQVAIVSPVSIDQLLSDRDYLLVVVRGTEPMTGFQIWRNTARSRAIVDEIAARCRLGGGGFPGEAALLSELGPLPWHSTIGDLHVAMHTAPNVEPRWRLVPTFAVCNEDPTEGLVERESAPRFWDALLAHIARCRRDAAPYLAWRDDGDSAERVVFNPARRIAFVTLYTPEVRAYGQIAEQNFRAYCERHGYTLYVHRAVPAETGLKASGNWLKPWLLHAYLASHEWVIWLDADVLINNQALRIERLLTGADRLMARDIGQWPFNSGIVGFRRTASNLSMLVDLMETINRLPDISTVYAVNGDQYYFIEAMKRHGLLDETKIWSPIVINTPWFFRQGDSFMVHYFGMWAESRALMMEWDEVERLARVTSDA